jgi:hypothetical protein
MELREPSDLTNISFDEFVSLIFVRDMPPPRRGDSTRRFTTWGWSLTPQKCAPITCNCFTGRSFWFRASRSSNLKRDSGQSWAIPSNGPRPTSLSSRKDCIESVAVLFERLFANEPLDTSVHMWWDSLCYAWHCGNRNRERGGEDLELQDIFFQTLSKVLAIDSWICQGAALHGLGHLHHPGTKELVNRYLDENPSLTTEQKAYALAAAEFQVL